MAEKRIIRTFEEFQGLDLKSTNLTRQPTSFKQISNSRFGEGRSIKKREGYQCIGQAGGFTRIFTHSYADPSTGATTEELLALNAQLWKLKKGTLTVTGGTTLNYYNLLTFSSSTYRLVIRDGSSAYTFSGNTYIDLGNGLESAAGSLVTIKGLQATIDAHASLACAVPSGIHFAIVNGDQTILANPSATITVLNTPHTYVAGDWVTFFDHTSQMLVAKRITSKGNTTLTIANDDLSSYTVKDGQVLGGLSTPAAGIFIKNAASGTTSSTTIDFYYWDIVPYTTSQFTYDLTSSLVIGSPWRNFHSSSPGATSYVPAHLINDNKCCYVHSRTIYQADSSSSKPHDEFPFKYDGQATYREGLPQPVAPTAAAGASGTPSGVYKYKYSFVQIDNRGNEIIGRVSDETSVTLSSQKGSLTLHHLARSTDTTKLATVNGTQSSVNNITVNAGHGLKANDWAIFMDRNPSPDAIVIQQIALTTATVVSFLVTVDVTSGDQIHLLKNHGFNTRGAIVNGGQTSTSTLTVFNDRSRPNTLEVGDTIFLYDDKRSRYTTRVVIGRTATTLAIDGEDLSVTDGYVITNNLRMRIYRTKAGGSIFYELVDIPFDYTNITTSYTDNAADSSLLVRLIEPEIGFEQDLPPRSSISITHQGTRIASGIKGEPNTLAIYDIENREGVPLASNYFDISSSVSGAITALSSDTEGSLAIFKPNAYYSANGDLPGGSFEIVPEMEGDYGIASQTSVAKIRGVTFGVGSLGIVALKNRQIMFDLGSLINPALQNNPSILLSQAVAINDWSKRGYHLYVPSTNGFTNGAAIGSYESFFFDYENNIWFDDDWRGSVEPSGGMAIYQDTEFILSKAYDTVTTTNNAAKNPGHVFRGLRLVSTITDPGNLYADNHLAISRLIKFIETLGTPSLDKEFLRFKVFSFYNPGEEDQFVSSTIGVNTYKDFQNSTIDSTLSLVFLTSSIFEASYKMKSNKARAMEFVIDDNSLFSSAQITGWEILVALPYREEEIKR